MCSHPLISRARFLFLNIALLLATFISFTSVSAQEERAIADRLLNQWLEAQNTGNFRQYSALYHPDFRGVRRSGNQRVEMNRTQWLKDRARMFQSAMNVSISNVRVELADGEILVYFNQRFKQGKYQDEGPKVMVIVEELNAVRVISEEMLRSDLISSRSASTLPDTRTIQTPPSEATYNVKGPISTKEAERIVAGKLGFTPRRGSTLVYESNEIREGRKYLVIHGYNTVIDSPNGAGHTATWGWYMVDSASGAAFEWDLTDDKLMPIRPLRR